MVLSHRMKQLLSLTKDQNFEDYKFNYYRKLRVYNIGFTKGCFDNFLECLYSLDDERYFAVVKDLENIPYGFIKNNQVLVINLISNNNSKDVITAYKMIEAQTQIISKYVFGVQNIAASSERKRLLLTVEKNLLLMKSEGEDNILRKAQKDFYNRFKNVENNPNLKGLYNQILDEFEIKMLDKLNTRRKQIDAKSQVLTAYKLNEHISDTINSNIKDRHSFRKRTR